jgi:hypothetical protein
MNVEFGMLKAEIEVETNLIFIISTFRIPTSEFLKPIVPTLDMLYNAVFQSQVIHEASGAVIVGPFLHKNQFSDAVGLSVFVIAVAVLVILIDSIGARMMAEFIDPFFLPGLDMVRFTAFGQHPCFKVTNGYQADTTPQAGGLHSGEGEQR